MEKSGITLIALVVTIVVLLILAGISINLVLGNNGLIAKSNEAKEQSSKSQAKDEVSVAINGTGFLVTHRGYEFNIASNYQLSVKEPFNAEEWDKDAASYDAFIWQSDDPNDEGYGVVIGYTAQADEYTILRFPSRCTKIEFSDSLDYNGIDTAASRAFTNNILKVEMPGTVDSIGEWAFGEPVKSFEKLQNIEMEYGVTSIGNSAFYECASLTSIIIPDSVTNIGGSAFSSCTNLTSITIPDSVTSIGVYAFSNVSHIYYNGTATGAPWGELAIN